jgi:pyridoxal phosphate-dependent aminotransferase EpsN
LTGKRIYLSVPHMSGHEQQFVNAAFESNWLSTTGPNLDAFEAEMSEFLGGPHTLAVSSGTAALHLILRYLGIGPGDEVAVPTLTFVGSVYPILYLGATPVLLDSEMASGNVDPNVVEDCFARAARRGRLPKALVAVHLYGQHANLDALVELCDRYGVPLVEDAAESLGSTYKGRQTATTASHAMLSFNGNKMITTTGGGMIVARDAAAIGVMRKWANQSREPGPEYVHEELGYNYRLSNVLAGIGRGQLLVLEDRVQARRRIADRYAELLADTGLKLQPEAAWGRHSRWLTVVQLDETGRHGTATEVAILTDRSNIECRPVWRPMHTQPLLRDCPYFGNGVAEQLATFGLCLPSSSNLSEAEQDAVIAAVKRAIDVTAARPTAGAGA